MTPFELQPPNLAGHPARSVVPDVMEAMAGLMDRAIERALAQVTVADMLVQEVDGDLVLVVHGEPAYVVKPNLLDVEITVSGGWLRWPLVDTED